MAATTPVTVEPEAAAYVEELGLRGPFEDMLRHALASIPGLLELHVSVQPAYDLEAPCVLLVATRPEPGEWVDDPSEREYGRWKYTTFPPEVGQHFVLLVGYR